MKLVPSGLMNKISGFRIFWLLAVFYKCLSKYSKYNDFTIRYRRDENPFQERHQSEHYKIEADFFIYGITNCIKINLGLCTDFIKFAVIDLNFVYKKLS